MVGVPHVDPLLNKPFQTNRSGNVANVPNILAGFVCIGALVLLNGGAVFWAAVPLVFYFGLIPLLDMAFGEDTSNPPEEIVEVLSRDNYYRALLFASIPVSYGSFFVVAYAIATLELP